MYPATLHLKSPFDAQNKRIQGKEKQKLKESEFKCRAYIEGICGECMDRPH